MKRFLFMLTLLIGAIVTNAENNVATSSATLPQGLQGVVNIELNNDIPFTAFTLRVTLPEGINFVLDKSGKPILEKGTRFSDHAISSSGVAENAANFACLSTSSAIISGNSGTLLSIYVVVDKSLLVGTELQVKLDEITFTTPDEIEYNLNDEIIVASVSESRILFDEAASSLPSFTAGERADVRMIRTIRGGIWNTLVLPFSLNKTQAETAFGEEVQIAEFSGWDTEYADGDDDVTPDDIVVHFTAYKLTARNQLRGGIPYIIKTSKDITSPIEADNVLLTAEVKPVEKADNNYTPGRFVGTLVKTTIPLDGLFIAEDGFWYSDGNTQTKAFRAWLQLDAVLGKDTENFGVKGIQFVIDGVDTDVDEIKGETIETENMIYNLRGQRIGRMQRGVNIVNGKKILK